MCRIKIEALCGQRAGKEKRESVEAVRGRGCVFCEKRVPAGLFLDDEPRPRARAKRLCERRRSWTSGKEGCVVEGCQDRKQERARCELIDAFRAVEARSL